MHILVLHRWRDGYARYGSYLDHRAHHVSYVTTTLGRSSVPAQAADVALVPATDDVPAVRAAVAGLVARFGTPQRIIALNEGDLDVAALLRRELNCPGQHPVDLARFRDKLVMVGRVAAAGITTPVFADAPDRRSIERFAAGHGWPVIVKPRLGTASRGVLRIDAAADLSRLDELPDEPRLVQTFVPDPVYHVDGLWTGTRLGPWRASRYVNTCVDFTVGAFLGSVEEDDPALLAAIGDFAAAVARALCDGPQVLHLEVFVGEVFAGAGGPGPRLTFLESGARVGGAEIPFLWREVHGVDLMAAAVDIQLGRSPHLPQPHGDEVGGWLLVPTPVPAPCRVVSTALSAPPAERPYASLIPAPGQVIPRVGGYEHVGARFRFRGRSSREVEQAILRTASGLRLDCAPLSTVDISESGPPRRNMPARSGR
jgi:hypothetical protein